MPNLADLTVLVTRPKPQGDILCERIQAAGGHAIYFPTLDIIPLRVQPILELDQYDWLIFVSANAVYHGVPQLIFSNRIKIAAVGASTATLLKEMKWPVHAYPKDEWNSEGLLSLPEFQKITGKKIVIVRGEGGRDVLEKELLSRGANVTHQIVYRRDLPKKDIKKIVELIHSHQIDVAIATSIESLQNFKKLLEKSCWKELSNIPLVVTSFRIKTQAIALKFKKYFLAKNASHDVIIETLEKNKELLCQLKRK
ncbi:MAG TPA: uroporphyrinogen-III synthase [Gammaproteobacteria bacterium]|nr:uroporphyrinogen-III synthase [Gammaproteobacteria bacterium]